MYTEKGFTNLLSKIRETGGMTDDMEDTLKKLHDDFNEREGILKKYGEAYDGEADEYNFKEKPVPNYSDELDELQEKYDTLVNRYNKRFFGGYKIDVNSEDNITVERPERETITVNDLFISKED